MENEQQNWQWQQGTEQWQQGTENVNQPFTPPQQQTYQQQMPNQQYQQQGQPQYAQQPNGQYQQPYQPQGYQQQPYQQPPQTVNVSVNYPYAAVPAGKKVVNKLAYVLFALFLGGFGIHNFYAGKIGLGILYLVFCWTLIPGIAAFIQAIVALCKPSDINGNILL